MSFALRLPIGFGQQNKIKGQEYYEGQGNYRPGSLPVWLQVAETALLSEGCSSSQRPGSSASALSGPSRPGWGWGWVMGGLALVKKPKSLYFPLVALVTPSGEGRWIKDLVQLLAPGIL